MGKVCHSQAFFKGLSPFQRQEISLPLRGIEGRGGGGDGGVFSPPPTVKLTSSYSDEPTWWLSLFFTVLDGGSRQLPHHTTARHALCRAQHKRENIHLSGIKFYTQPRCIHNQHKAIKTITKVLTAPGGLHLSWVAALIAYKRRGGYCLLTPSVAFGAWMHLHGNTEATLKTSRRISKAVIYHLKVMRKKR